jgi:rhodanese-related sulfurtransferase
MSTAIGLERLRALLADGAQLVEVLPAEDFAPAHLPGAVSLPLRELDADRAAGLDRTRPVVVYCWDSL